MIFFLSQAKIFYTGLKLCHNNIYSKISIVSLTYEIWLGCKPIPAVEDNDILLGHIVFNIAFTNILNIDFMC